MIECTSCLLRFTSTKAFDMHRTGSYGEAVYNSKNSVIGYTAHSRRCLNEPAMVEKEMKKMPDGRWSTGAIVDFHKKSTHDDGPEGQIEEDDEEL